MKKDLLSEYELEKADFDRIFDRAAVLKDLHRNGRHPATLAGKVLGMFFDKASTRTRLSFEVGMYQLGGMALFLSGRDTQIGRGETVADTARVMSRYLDGIMIRTFSQEMVEEFALNAPIPVINGLTDLLHPCQILTDIFTILEKKGTYEGIRVAYVGDGNNIANSWINAAAKLPLRLSLACPEGYDPDPEILARGLEEARLGMTLHRDPVEAVRDAEVIYTDVWASMGREDEHEERVKRFQDYQINEQLVGRAARDVMVMHCLPAHRGEEITAGVIDGPHSIVFDQAENRLHVQKAVMEILMSGGS
ncbi:MAG: ornithine carbamoyltransferase [Deltaproteobacteria bacterium]|nr:ornithine carbamoyltransferase [Deltaproteobacteria bacterium]